MKFCVQVNCISEAVERREQVFEMEREHLTIETLGLGLGESKALLRGVQEFVVAEQVAVDLERRRNCPSCGKRHTVLVASTSRTAPPVVGPRGGAVSVCGSCVAARRFAEAGLFNSCASPAAIVPSAESRWCCCTCMYLSNVCLICSLSRSSRRRN